MAVVANSLMVQSSMFGKSRSLSLVARKHLLESSHGLVFTVAQAMVSRQRACLTSAAGTTCQSLANL
ncbi:hypothetical protein KCU85_g63, partial [Aureobasidium melanogenum]